jgi:hypothetical protein
MEVQLKSARAHDYDPQTGAGNCSARVGFGFCYIFADPQQRAYNGWQGCFRNICCSGYFDLARCTAWLTWKTCLSTTLRITAWYSLHRDTE